MTKGIDPIEEALLNALTECLERAMELACDAQALESLGEIGRLATDAAAVARCGALLLISK
jgi:hypothetical protein